MVETKQYYYAHNFIMGVSFGT